jgi:membrane protease subunit HflC
MTGNRRTLVVAVLIVLVLLLQLVAFRVRETERAVVKTFGKATRDVSAAGLYWKWPWPIEEVVLQDARLRVLEGPLEEASTADRKSVLVSCFVTWRPGKPVEFLERHETEKAAEKTLEGLLGSTQTSVLGRHPFSSLIAQDRSQLRWDELEAEIREPLVQKARDDYAIEVVFVGIRRLALPRDTTETVFARMRAERDGKAKALLAEGETEARRIRDKAENERRQLVDEAEADARVQEAGAIRDSAEAYAVLDQQPDLAIDLRKIEALKRGLSGRTTVIFDLATWPFDVLKDVAAVGSRSPMGR